MRRTKIVATIGPSSREPDVLRQLVRAGMDVARLNFAHGDHEQHAETIERIRAAAEDEDRQIAVLQDLPGPKLRIGPVEDDVVELANGEHLVLANASDPDEMGSAERMTVSWDGLAEAVEVGEVLFLADGSIRLRVEAVRPGDGEIETVVEVGGTVASRQGLNVPGELSDLPTLPEEDLEDLRFGESIGVDLVALSFVRRPEDVTQVREHTRLPLVAKIEKPQAVETIEGIIGVSDCLMVARGDLGIELPMEEVPIVQKQVIEGAGRLARPVITATQMLDSMVTSARPTRAEVTDVANAILDGSDAVMLSQETAVGAHPVEAVRTMAKIAERTEDIAPYERWNEQRVKRDSRDPAYTIAYNACSGVRQLRLDALVVPTLSGRSARLISAHRPDVPIFALSPGKETVRRCALMWGVQAAAAKRCETTEELISECAQRVLELGWAKRGQRVGITAGLPSGRPGTTSLFQVQEL